MKAKRWGFMALAVALALVMLWGCQAWVKPEEPEARSYNTACYMEQGGSRWVCGDGGTMYIGDGGTLEVVAGATLSMGGYLTSTIDDLTVSGTTDLMGNVSSSTGALTITDAVLVTGTLEVDGATTFDGAVTLNGTLDVDGNISSGTGAVTVTDDLYVTGTAQIVGAISNPTANVTIADHLDVQNTINYGTSDLYPIGSEDSNFQFSWGSNVITGALAITQKVGQPTMAWCTLAQTPVDANGNVCTTLIVGNVVTVSVWLSNSTASAAGVNISWLVIGIP